MELTEAPHCPGIYRLTWEAATDDWRLLQKTVSIRASARVSDPTLDFGEMIPPILLTIGRATDVHIRFRQHFGTNPHNNRVIKRLSSLMPGKSLEEMRDIAIRNLLIEWAIVTDWRERWVLEKYGCGLGAPLLDFEAEH